MATIEDTNSGLDFTRSILPDNTTTPEDEFTKSAQDQKDLINYLEDGNTVTPHEQELITVVDEFIKKVGANTSQEHMDAVRKEMAPKAETPPDTEAPPAPPPPEKSTSSAFNFDLFADYEFLKLNGFGEKYAHSGWGDFLKLGLKAKLTDSLSLRVGVPLSYPIGKLGAFNLKNNGPTPDDQTYHSQIQPAGLLGASAVVEYGLLDGAVTFGVGGLLISQGLKTPKDKMSEVKICSDPNDPDCVNELGRPVTDAKPTSTPDGTSGLYDPEKKVARHVGGDKDVTIKALVGEVGINIPIGENKLRLLGTVGIGTLDTPNFKHPAWLIGFGAGIEHNILGGGSSKPVEGEGDAAGAAGGAGDLSSTYLRDSAETAAVQMHLVPAKDATAGYGTEPLLIDLTNTMLILETTTITKLTIEFKIGDKIVTQEIKTAEIPEDKKIPILEEANSILGDVAAGTTVDQTVSVKFKVTSYTVGETANPIPTASERTLGDIKVTKTGAAASAAGLPEPPPPAPAIPPPAAPGGSERAPEPSPAAPIAPPPEAPAPVPVVIPGGTGTTETPLAEVIRLWKANAKLAAPESPPDYQGGEPLKIELTKALGHKVKITATLDGHPNATLAINPRDKKAFTLFAKTNLITAPTTAKLKLTITSIDGTAVSAVDGALPDMAVKFVPAKRPNWISADEEAYLNRTGGLKPVVNLVGNKVQIKLKKLNATLAVLPHQPHNLLKVVAVSFNVNVGGKNYFYTHTQVPIVGAYPVMTSYTGGGNRYEWRKVPDNEALRVLNDPASKAKIKTITGKTDEEVNEYIEDMKDELDATTGCSGHHYYDPRTGFYEYEQTATLSGFDPPDSDVKEAALKVAFKIIGAGNLAGSKGNAGPEVNCLCNGREDTINASK